MSESSIVPQVGEDVSIVFPDDSCHPKAFHVDKVVHEFDVMGYVRSTIMVSPQS